MLEMGLFVQLLFSARQLLWSQQRQDTRQARRRGVLRNRRLLCQHFLQSFSNLMSVAIEAALKPMKERLEATILPMQRILEGLQAEFVALRAEEKNDFMTSVTAADAKRLRTGLDA